MRNFYHAESNAAAMVQFVMAKVRGLSAAAAAAAAPHARQQDAAHRARGDC